MTALLIKMVILQVRNVRSTGRLKSIHHFCSIISLFTIVINIDSFIDMMVNSSVKMPNNSETSIADSAL